MKPLLIFALAFAAGYALASYRLQKPAPTPPAPILEQRATPYVSPLNKPAEPVTYTPHTHR